MAEAGNVDGTMPLSDLNVNRGFRLSAELLELVTAVVDSPVGTQETNWLEWKRELELDKPAGRFAIAKAILGFANRSVEQAQLCCGGAAYMIVGAEPGAATGVEIVDHAVLGQKIATYVDGPRWTPHYIECNQKHVLVIVVEPPRPGDPIHTLQKAYSRDDKAGYHAGLIFQRATAHTEPAGARGIAELQERLVSGTRIPDLGLTLGLSATRIVRLSLSKNALNEFIGRHEAYVRANIGAPRPPSSSPDQLGSGPGYASAFGVARWLQSQTPEDQEQFDRRVSAYLVQLRKVLLHNVIARINRSRHLNTITFEVANKTDDPISGVQCTVEIPSPNLVVYTSAPYSLELPATPKWPDHMTDSLNRYNPALGLPGVSQFSQLHDGIADKQGDAYRYTWNIGDLRPHEVAPAQSVTIIPRGMAPDNIDVTMTASAMNRRGRVTETFTLSIDAERRTIYDFYNPQKLD